MTKKSTPSFHLRQSADVVLEEIDIVELARLQRVLITRLTEVALHENARHVGDAQLLNALLVRCEQLLDLVVEALHHLEEVLWNRLEQTLSGRGRHGLQELRVEAGREREVGLEANFLQAQVVHVCQALALPVHREGLCGGVVRVARGRNELVVHILRDLRVLNVERLHDVREEEHALRTDGQADSLNCN